VRRAPAARAAASVVVLALAAAPAVADTPPRLADFSEVWTTVRDHFYDPALRGVDWQAERERWSARAAGARTVDELSAAINGMLSALDTSHTAYYTDRDPAYWFLVDLFDVAGLDDTGYVGIGVFTETIEGQTFVRSVVDGGPAAKAGVLAGDRLVAVGDAPWHPILPFAGRENLPVRLRVERDAQGRDVRELAVVPQRIRPVEFYREALAASARRLSRPGVEAAYVRVWSYAGRENHDALIRVLNTPELASADGLVLDLRDGWGGASPDYLTLFSDRVPTVVLTRRGGEPAAWDTQWRKPVVLLVDGTTRSGKEILAHGFQRYGYGPVVGARTAGAVVPGKLHRIGERAVLYLANADLSVDGERLEGRGVIPDHEVPFDLRWAAGADPRLERALAVLRDLVRANGHR
jgi:carboxyl-terminal processing protease